MNPIKNVFTASEGSEKRSSSERKCWLCEEETNGSVGSTKKRQSWKSGDETPVETAILNVLNPSQMKDTLFLALEDCSASYNVTRRKTETLKLIVLTLSQN